MARVMCVGIATLDIVCKVKEYPLEDSEVRALAQSQRTGGNAANTAIVLAQLGDRVSWVGNLAQPAEIAERDFAHHGVDITKAVRIPGKSMPTSYVLLSESTGSRSIVHYREMPEYRASDFSKLDLREVDWVHFEGRATDQVAQMLPHARSNRGVAVSLEVEKPRAGIEELFGQADLILFSRDYAEAKGCRDAVALLQGLPANTLATCTWGSMGAWAVDRDGQIMHAPARQLDKVVDTLGAGDVFNAAMIHALNAKRSMSQALQEAVRLASSKCAHEGLVLSV